MIRAVLTAVFLVGLEWKGLRCHRRASPRPEKTTPNIQKENIEKYEEKDKQHHDNNKENIRGKKKRCKNKDTCYDKN